MNFLSRSGSPTNLQSAPYFVPNSCRVLSIGQAIEKLVSVSPSLRPIKRPTARFAARSTTSEPESPATEKSLSGVLNDNGIDNQDGIALLVLDALGRER